MINLDVQAEVTAALKALMPEIRKCIGDAVADALNEKLLDVDDAAKLTGDSPAALRKRIARGKLPVVRIGSRVKVRLRDLCARPGEERS